MTFTEIAEICIGVWLVLVLSAGIFAVVEFRQKRQQPTESEDATWFPPSWDEHQALTSTGENHLLTTHF